MTFDESLDALKTNIAGLMQDHATEMAKKDALIALQSKQIVQQGLTIKAYQQKEKDGNRTSECKN